MRPFRILRSRSVYALLVTLLFVGVVRSKADVPHEYALKAAFILNFATFVEWPAGVFDSPESPIVIGILGEDRFGASLHDIVAGERIRKRSLVVRRVTDLRDSQGVHILYVVGAPDNLAGVLADLRKRPILLIGESPDIFQAGGAIRMVTGSRVRFEINAANLKQAGLTASSKLLRLGQATAAAQP